MAGRNFGWVNIGFMTVGLLTLATVVGGFLYCLDFDLKRRDNLLADVATIADISPRDGTTSAEEWRAVYGKTGTPFFEDRFDPAYDIPTSRLELYLNQ
tara:strand:- start:844 stop:1137 length:294 start_codon:yes stop_codon:yes gene_type:complete